MLDIKCQKGGQINHTRILDVYKVDSGHAIKNFVFQNFKDGRMPFNYSKSLHQIQTIIKGLQLITSPEI